MIVMGVFLMIIAWRLSKSTTGWTTRLIVSGAVLLAFGYSVMLPLYEAGLIERYAPLSHYHGGAATALAWHAVKILAMNCGWLFFGLGLAMHAKIFNANTPFRKLSHHTLATHESVA